MMSNNAKYKSVIEMSVRSILNCVWVCHMHICVHIGRGSKTMCVIVLQALFYMHRIIVHTHTHVLSVDDRLTLHMLFGSQVY